MIEGLINSLDLYLLSSVPLAFVAVYLAGVLVSFTPCVYPVIPITIAYIGAQKTTSKLQGFLISIFYVLGTSITYTSLGILASLTGQLFGEIQSSPWTFFIVANLCLFMGLAMLEAFTLPLPGFISSQRKGSPRAGLLGGFLIGAASGLILGPCTAPVLGVILGYVATKQHLLFGMGLLFVFSFGMGTILIILGTFTGLITNLPKPGLWMIRIQKAFGWIFIALGEYFLIVAGSRMI
ncbi:MAG: cytochrome c biogenesis protein CcdA [Desulfomonilia bacterium]|nr:cytochrome c biogenesis protein CcdA [Desulfomonilia bacterium]